MTRAAKPSHCPRCQQPTLTGLDDDTAALTITTGTQPLTAQAEATALLAGRATYRLRTIAGQVTLTRRNHWAIAANPADPGITDVTTDHECGDKEQAQRTAIPIPTPSPEEIQNEFPF